MEQSTEEKESEEKNENSILSKRTSKKIRKGEISKDKFKSDSSINLHMTNTHETPIVQTPTSNKQYNKQNKHYDFGDMVSQITRLTECIIAGQSENIKVQTIIIEKLDMKN